MDKTGHFEWVSDCSAVMEYLDMARLGCSHDMRVLDIGCGTSMLPICMRRQPGIASVVAIDRDAGCVAHMRSAHAAEQIEWLTCDICNGATEYLAPGLVEDGFDLIVDKGTFDCALVES